MKNLMNKKSSRFTELLQWIFALVLAVAAALLVDNFLIVNAQIPSSSMENTVMTGDRIIGNRLAYLSDDPQRFDIIIFRYPDDESQLFIKRIIGLPGETVEIIDGKIYIDGSSQPLQDVNTKETPLGSFGPFKVKTAILSWETTVITLWIPVTGRIPTSDVMRYWAKPFSDTGRWIR